MNDIIAVHVSKALDKLVHNIFYHLRFESFWGFFKDLKKVVFDVLENEVDNSFSSEGVSEFNNVGVFHVFKNFDLSHGNFAYKLIVF